MFMFITATQRLVVVSVVEEKLMKTFMVSLVYPRHVPSLPPLALLTSRMSPSVSPSA